MQHPQLPARLAYCRNRLRQIESAFANQMNTSIFRRDQALLRFLECERQKCVAVMKELESLDPDGGPPAA